MRNPFTFVSLLAASLLLARDVRGADRHKEWSWQPMAIGAGGWMRGMVIHPSDATLRYARADTFGAYRWDAATGSWSQMITSTSFSSGATATASDGKTYPLLANPLGGNGVDAIAIAPTDENVVLVSMDMSPPDDITGGHPFGGNVYVSKDRGRTFTPSTGLTLPLDKACTGGDIGSFNTIGERLAVDPKNANVVYVGTMNSGLWGSTDGGATFASVSGGGAPPTCQEIHNILVDGHEVTTRAVGAGSLTVSKTVYVLADVADASVKHGVYASTNGGATWSLVSTGQPAITSGLGGSTLDSTGALWVMTPDALLRYAGGSWTRSTPPRKGGGVAIDPADPMRVFVDDGQLGLARSTDGGKTWTDLGAPHYASSDGIGWIGTRPNSTSHGSFLFDPGPRGPDGKGRLWVSHANYDVVYVDLDDTMQPGATTPLTWMEQAKGVEQLVAQNVVAPPGNHGSIAVSAEDESGFYIDDPNRFTAFHYDVDTSQQGNNELSSAGMVAFCPDTPALMVNTTSNLFAGTWRGGAFKNNFAGYSTNFGKNWTLLPSIKATSGDNSYGGGSITNTPPELVGGEIAISARGDVFPGKGQAAWTGKDNLVWLPFGSAGYSPFGAATAPYYSFDGGATWQPGSLLDAAGHPLADSSGPVTKISWVFVDSSKAFGLVADPVTPKVFYAWSEGHGFFSTSDGGATWKKGGDLQPPIPYFFINQQLAAVPGKAGDLWFSTGPGAPGSAGFLYHSTDGGATWQGIAVDKCETVAVGKGAPGKDYAVYLVGRPKPTDLWGVYRSDDHGTNWDLISGDGMTGFPFGHLDPTTHLAASQETEGLLYVGFGGSSFGWGYQIAVGNPYSTIAVAPDAGAPFDATAPDEDASGGGAASGGSSMGAPPAQGSADGAGPSPGGCSCHVASHDDSNADALFVAAALVGSAARGRRRRR